MPFKFSKAERRDPLTPEEAVLARNLYDAIRRANNKIKVEELARMIERLDPDKLNRLLNAITISGDRKRLEDSLLSAIDIGGNAGIKEIQSLASRLAFPNFKPSKVKIDNKTSLRGLEFTKIPAWASSTRPKMDVNISFDKTNPNSLFFAQKRAAELITAIDDLTRQGVRQIIIDSFNDKVDYRTTAKRIKNVVGLHPKWAQAVVKYENRQFARLVAEGFKETAARNRASTMATDYSERLKSARATMIARTEIQIAQNEGRLESWKQAAKDGFVDPDSQKMWVTAKDERTCDICGELDGEVVGWLDTFSNGLEKPIAHPHCRCTIKLIPPAKYADIYSEMTYEDYYE
jgi:SPP1 gp7 family putative phage head morphogenesis protein